MHRLWQGLVANPDLFVRRFVQEREQPDSESMCFGEPGRARRALRDIAGWTGLSHRSAWNTWQRQRNLQALLKHVHWTKPAVINIHGFNQWTAPGLARASVLKLAEIAPVVWTLHDLWPLTGTSDYAESPGREIASVQAGASDADGRSLRALGKRLTWVSPSRWITELARSAYGDDNPCATIPYGVDTTLFQPMEQSAARSVWSFPPDEPLLLVVAHRLDAPRKGVGTLLEALAAMPHPPALVLAGDGVRNLNIPDKVSTYAVGAVSDLRLLRTLFAAVDALVVPSLEDNLPNVMLEALACGTPVFGSSIGGIPDAVRPGSTGWLAPAGDAEAWREVLSQALHRVRENRSEWSRRCRATAEQEYTLRVQAGAYRKLFEDVIARNATVGNA